VQVKASATMFALLRGVFEALRYVDSVNIADILCVNMSYEHRMFGSSDWLVLSLMQMEEYELDGP
jgi:hypothetical protein